MFEVSGWQQELNFVKKKELNWTHQDAPKIPFLSQTF